MQRQSKCVFCGTDLQPTQQKPSLKKQVCEACWQETESEYRDHAPDSDPSARL